MNFSHQEAQIMKTNLLEEQEMEEITNFFNQVDNLKKKIMDQLKNNSKENSILETFILSETEIISLFLQNVNLVNIISEDTIKIYIESIFIQNHEGKFEITEDSLESFLTSIMIFSNNDE